MIAIEFGYTQYVLSVKDALAMSEILERAEIYEKKWIPTEARDEGGPSETVHVYMNDREISMRLISNSLYQMAKLAGKPTK